MLVYVDVETTGLELNDAVCSLAVLVQKEEENTFVLYESFVNEGKKIPPSASAIHNITNEMIQNAPSLEQSSPFIFLQEHLSKKTVTVSHGFPFTAKFLNDKVQFFEFIDTMRVCKHLIPDLESYSLNFLRYEMRLYKKEKKFVDTLKSNDFCLQPHDAKSDVIITKLLLDELLELAMVEELVALSQKPVIVQKFEFGKYNGRYIEEIAMIDRGYLEWMLHNLEDLNEDMRYTLEYYL